MKNFDTIEAAIADLKAGKMVIVVDDEDRENEGDMVMAASRITPDAVNFMVHNGSGVITVPVSRKIAEHLKLPPMVVDNTEKLRTNFTVSVDFKHGTTTGISAVDRSITIKAISDAKTQSTDLLRPGHIFPLLACDGGVLVRQGHTEASIDLMKIAKLPEAAVLCELVLPNGEMARMNDLLVFAKKHSLKIIKIKDLIEYRLRTEKLLRVAAKSTLHTAYGLFDVLVYQTELDDKDYFVLVKNEIKSDSVPLVRIHSECLTGDVFKSCRCDCGLQLDQSLKMVGASDGGILIYLHQEGRGIGLANKIKSYGLQDHGFDTVDANTELGFKADLREYHIAAQILLNLGVKNVKLITNNPQKINDLEDCGIKVVERIPIEIAPNKINKKYLQTKKQRMGHLLNNV